jgi:hypothetical protein
LIQGTCRAATSLRRWKEEGVAARESAYEWRGEAQYKDERKGRKEVCAEGSEM